MNWLRTILDGISICIALNGVVAFVWLLEPIGFSVMLPKGINTPLKEWILEFWGFLSVGLVAARKIHRPAHGAGDRR